ncbi:MAG: hypothetical protein OEZ33_08845 [Gammaproteobacteria bacterium]|nr:hypothetical protein [Gammaproteobacteria bacterium]MDH5778304.1 hypothetical protein [Gammaproteobacteria bacterium]
MAYSPAGMRYNGELFATPDIVKDSLMVLNVIVGEQPTQIDVPEFLLSDAIELFNNMDIDMDKGWQMSRIWVDELTDIQRCQVVADRLLTAMESENENMKLMMAGYILYKMPEIKNIFIDSEGDMTATEIEV